jgi:hypothetical protein
MNAPLSAKRHQIILIEECRARPDKTQVARKNAPQLRQFVETRLAENLPKGIR